MQVQQTIIEENGLGGVLHDRLQDQERQEQQGHTRDDDGDGDEEEEEEDRSGGKVDCTDAAVQVDEEGGGVAAQIARVALGSAMGQMETKLLAEIEARLQKQRNELVSSDCLAEIVTGIYKNIDDEILIMRKKVTQEIEAALELKRTQETAAANQETAAANQENAAKMCQA